MNETKLKPCFECGSLDVHTVYINHKWIAWCAKCKSQVSGGRWIDEEGVIKSWNSFNRRGENECGREINMVDEYKFKAGDKVITALGETGMITRICKCDKCKERGFYEPAVLCDEEDDYITITDTDFKNGFKNFYKIGDYVFGNIDFDTLLSRRKCILKDLEQINKHMSNLRNELDAENGRYLLLKAMESLP